MPCIPTWWIGESRVEQRCRLHGTAFWRQCGSFATKFNRLDTLEDMKITSCCGTQASIPCSQGVVDGMVNETYGMRAPLHMLPWREGARDAISHQVLGPSVGRTAPCWWALWNRRPLLLCPVNHKLLSDEFCWDGAQKRLSGPASKFVDGAPPLMAGVREVDGIDSFASSGRAAKAETKQLFQSQSQLGLGERSKNESRTLLPTWHIDLATATWDTLFSRK